MTLSLPSLWHCPYPHHGTAAAPIMKLLLPLSIHCSCDQAYVDLTSNAMSCCGRGFTVLSEEPFNWWVQMAGLGEQSLPQGCSEHTTLN